jgi:hypothetical protein
MGGLRRHLRKGELAAALAMATVAIVFGLARGPSWGRAVPFKPSTDAVETPVIGAWAWPIGKSQPIAVHEGHSRFVVSSRSPQARTLVIISALMRTDGKYPVRISAKSANQAEVPELANDGPTTRPLPIPNTPAETQASPLGPPPELRTFHLPVRDGDPSSASNYVAVNARLRAFSSLVQVYVDPADLERVESSTLADIVRTFDEHVLPKSRETIGTARDVDHDHRFTILLSNWLGHLADGRLSVDGYVRGADFEPQQLPPFGNRGDVMYLNASMQSGPHLRTIMAHEYTHAVTYCRKALGAGRKDEEGWLDEALAHLSEDLHGFSRTNLDHRVEAFLADPEKYRLLVQDFGAPDLIRSHGHRGGSYLFVRWCARRFGPDVMRRLVCSDLRGVANLEAATGQTFAALYRGWAADLYLSSGKPEDPLDSVPPRASRIAPDGADDRAELSATTSHFVVVEGTKTGALEIVVSAPAEALIQVTAIPLPEDASRVDLSIGWEPANDGPLGMVARIREQDDRQLTIRSLEWTVDDQDPRRPPRRIVMEGDRLRNVLGSVILEAHGRLISRPISVKQSGVRNVRLVATDSRGRSVVSWAARDR